MRQRTNRPRSLVLGLASIAALAAASAALGQVSYTEPPDLGNGLGSATPLGTVDTGGGGGPNEVHGTLTAIWAPFSSPSGDYDDSFSFVVPAGVEVRSLVLIVTNFSTNNAAARIEFGPGGFATIPGNGTFSPAIPGGALHAGTQHFSIFGEKLADGLPATAVLTYELRINAVRLDDCAQAAPAGPGTTPFDTTNATTDGPEHDECNFFNYRPIDKDTWFTFTPAIDGAASVTTCGSGFDTKLAIYQGAACDNLAASILACNDDNPTCGVSSRQSAVLIAVAAGQTYLIRVGGFSGASGAGVLNIGLSTDGACCNRATGGCAVVSEAACQAFDGEFAGFATACAPGACTACPADFNRSGVVSVQDIFDFLAAYFAGCP